MKIFIDNTEVIVHLGAKVLDALRAYYALCGKRVPRSLPDVEDAYGNTVSPDGELSERSRLYIKERKQ